MNLPELLTAVLWPFVALNAALLTWNGWKHHVNTRTQNLHLQVQQALEKRIEGVIGTLGDRTRTIDMRLDELDRATTRELAEMKKQFNQFTTKEAAGAFVTGQGQPSRFIP